MMRVFIGYDKNETVAYHVAAHSILRRSSIPVSITPINKDNMKGFWTRPRGEFDSTDFSNSRFLTPFLSGYEGFSLFIDSDMLILGDIAEMANYCSVAAQYNQAVRVVKHKYEPKEETKFLGAIQTKYSMKNWSSVMLFNNRLCQNLTLEYCNKAAGLDMHQFKWTEPHMVGDLPPVWNVLVEEDNQPPIEEAKLLHYTKGTPCFTEYSNCTGADLWFDEFRHMTSHA